MLFKLLVGLISLQFVSSATIANSRHVARKIAIHGSLRKSTAHVKTIDHHANIRDEHNKTRSLLYLSKITPEVRDPMDFDPMGSLGQCYGCSDHDSDELALQARGFPGKYSEHRPKDNNSHVMDHAEAAAHGDGHHVDYTDPVTALVSMMLFGCVSWVVSMFYFVNYPDDDIQLATWSTLSTMISIFAAVLVFSASTESLVDFAGLRIHHHGPPPTYTLFWGYTRWLFLTAVLQFCFVYLRNDAFKLKMVSNLAGHIVGFGAIDAFGVSLHMPVFSSSLTGSFLGVCFAVLCLLGFVGTIHKIRVWAVSASSFDGGEEAKQEWIEVCTESESESLGLTLGLLWSMLIRYAIVGSLPAVHGDPQYKSDIEVWLLFTNSLVLTPLVVIASMVKDEMEERGSHEILMWVAEVTCECTYMTMGWTLLYWGYWMYYDWMEDQHGRGGKVGMRITMACMFSALSFCAIIWLDFAADRTSSERVEKGMRSILKTFALLMGLAWEATFASAVKAVGHTFEGHEATFVIDALVLLICAVVLPAWALYILPKTFDESGRVQKMEMGQARRASPLGKGESGSGPPSQMKLAS